MKVVLDTNIFLSSLLSPHGSANIIYRAWQANKFVLVTSRIQLDEIRRASRYPKFKAILQPAHVGTMLNNLQHAIVIKRLVVKEEAADPNDAFLLSMAIEAKADYLITGDKRAGLLQMKNIGRTRILNPADFCSEVIK